MIRFYSYIIVLSALLISSMQLFAQEPVAPWAPLKPDAPEEWGSRKYPVPSKDEIGIPVYPNSYLTTVSAEPVDTLKQRDSGILPFIILVSSDSPAKAISFYKEFLKPGDGWSWSEEYSTFIKSDPMIKVLTGRYPSVAIREENGDNFDLNYVKDGFKKKLKTRIQITYKPVR